MKKLIVLFLLINAFLLWMVFSPAKVNKVVIAVPTPTPTEIPIPTPTNLSADKLFQLVNNWRVQNGYQAYIKSDFDCKFALERLPEIETTFSHEKFYIHSNNETVAGTKMAENLAQGYWSEQETLIAWIHSPEHLDNLKAPYDHSCIETDGHYAVEIFSYF